MERNDNESLSLRFRVIYFLLKSLLAGTTTVMHRYGPNDTYPFVFNMKRTTYLYLLADFYDASQFEMINFGNVNIETL